MILQIDKTAGVKTPSNVPSFELSGAELPCLTAIDLCLLFRVSLRTGFCMIPECTVGSIGLATLGRPRRCPEDVAVAEVRLSNPVEPI
jgi:hypothetical protein